MFLATVQVEWGWQADGCIRLLVDGDNLLRGPLGVVVAVVLAPVYRLLPPPSRAGFLIAGSLGLILLTLGAAYALTLAGMALLSLAIVRTCARPSRVRYGAAGLAAVHLAWAGVPQPPWLPPVAEPVYFYVHWAGVAYLMLRSWHVLMDRAAGRLSSVASLDYLAFLLFPPTLRMGPLMRYQPFAEQLQAPEPGPVRPGTVILRVVTGLVRLGITVSLVDRFPARALYHPSPEMTGLEILLHIYAVLLALYFWIGAYTDLAVAVGRTFGFTVPDNFNYPWRAASIDEFWRRWHIPVYNWLKDYIFMPLARRRWHYLAAFTATFLVCGLWHGTYLTYLLWGLSQGLGMSVHRWWARLWREQRQRQTPLYRCLSRSRLVASPLSTAAAWLLTFHYQAVTISLGLDGEGRCRDLWRHLGHLLST